MSSTWVILQMPNSVLLFKMGNQNRCGQEKLLETAMAGRLAMETHYCFGLAKVGFLLHYQKKRKTPKMEIGEVEITKDEKRKTIDPDLIRNTSKDLFSLKERAMIIMQYRGNNLALIQEI